MLPFEIPASFYLTIRLTKEIENEHFTYWAIKMNTVKIKVDDLFNVPSRQLQKTRGKKHEHSGRQLMPRGLSSHHCTMAICNQWGKTVHLGDGTFCILPLPLNLPAMGQI